MNKLKYFLSIFLLYAIVPIVHADPTLETASVKLVNPKLIPYSIFNYTTSSDAHFVNQPDTLPGIEVANIFLNLKPGSSGSFTYRPTASSQGCVMNPDNLWGRCTKIKFHYDDSGETGVPSVEMVNTIGGEFSIYNDYDKHHVSVTVILPTTNLPLNLMTL